MESAETREQEQIWLSKAALFELLAFGLRLPTKELAEAVLSGEYAEALEELAELNALGPETSGVALKELSGYKEPNSTEAEQEKLFHALRVEYTYLLVGSPEPAVSPYAGVWWAREAGVAPLLFVNKESMAVERFMRSCGIGQPEGTNEPLDHIASELEFLQYLCMLRAKAALPPELPEDFVLPKQAFEEFYEKHFTPWSKQLAASLIEKARIPYYRALARVLAELP